jgi:hypothetical protein
MTSAAPASAHSLVCRQLGVEPLVALVDLRLDVILNSLAL